MLNRQALKARAKESLRGHYWTAFVATLALGLVNGGGRGISGRFSVQGVELENLGTLLHRPGFLLGLITGLAVAFCFSLALSIFVALPLKVGESRYFTTACCRRYELGSLGFGFRYNYLNVVKAMLLREVRVLLWSLLFIIPGIVKGFAYSMVPYLLADNPNLSPGRAIALSCRLTDGHKTELFGLSLSFFGWFLLGSLCCGVGTLFVMPYYEAAWAEAYMALRHEALQRGDTTLEELCLSYQ